MTATNWYTLRMKASDQNSVSSTQQLPSSVQHLNFDVIKQKILLEPEVAWDRDDCEFIESEYRRFLTLALRYPDRHIVPTKLVDTFWHYHILDTQKYYSDSEAVFGGILHHYPYFGLGGPDAKLALKTAFEETKQLYRETFDAELPHRLTGSAECGSACAASSCAPCESNLRFELK
jgi:hypothetical protein